MTLTLGAWKKRGAGRGQRIRHEPATVVSIGHASTE